LTTRLKRVAQFLAVAAFLAITSSASRAAEDASVQMLRKALDPNPTLVTYTASASLTVTLHVLVPVSTTLTGTAYYHKPVRKIDFDDIPPALKQFSELVATTPTYEQVLRDYRMSPAVEEGTTSTYALIPRRNGRVKSLKIRIGVETGLIEQTVWTYKDGQTLSVSPTYANVGAFRLPATVAIAAHFPGYNADGVLRFSNYHLGAAVTL
jgi:hypothetical protein